jgi:four helix bundle protein
MAPRDHKELRCWQLANQLRGEVHDICEIPAAAQDFKFCNSFRDAIGSVCRNLSEGFARGTPCEIAQYFRYALASLEETKDHLEECRIRTLLTAEKLDRLLDIAEHTKATGDQLHEAPRRTMPPAETFTWQRQATAGQLQLTVPSLVARGTARGTPHVARRTWHVARGTWHVARGTWHVARRTSHVARGTSARRTSHVARRT